VPTEGTAPPEGSPPREIAPGLFHWSAFHPEQKVVVSSYYVGSARVLVDPMVPDDGLAWFESRAPEHVLLTNRYHSRGSAAFAEAFGCPVLCHKAGLEHVRERVAAAEPFEHGAVLAGGIEALAVPGEMQDETALLVLSAGGGLTFADILIREGDGPLGYAPDGWYGDDPEPAKARVVEAGRALLARDFRHLLLTHGEPLVDEGKEALRAFLEREA
jgi:glyoxylase-like metal-dependent hydrolase (beta-lactamase superfamily II)